jgi:hypothetical protein
MSDESKPRQNVAVLIPSYDGKLFLETSNGLIAFASRAARENISFSVISLPGNALIDNARNTLMHIALQQDFTDLFWLDADIGFTANDIIRLLKYDVDMVGGAYPKKNRELNEEYVWKPMLSKDGGFIFDRAENPQLVATQYLGMGFVRMRAAALRKLVDLYRETHTCLYNIQGKQAPVVHLFQQGVGVDGRYCGEDVAFFNAWKSAGNLVWCDPHIRLQHVGRHVWDTGRSPAEHLEKDREQIVNNIRADIAEREAERNGKSES